MNKGIRLTVPGQCKISHIHSTYKESRINNKFALRNNCFAAGWTLHGRLACVVLQYSTFSTTSPYGWWSGSRSSEHRESHRQAIRHLQIKIYLPE